MADGRADGAGGGKGMVVRVMAGALVARGDEACAGGFVEGFEAPLVGSVLLARRKGDRRMGGLWELPGGKIEPGESEAEALARELMEELGLEVEVGAFIAFAESGPILLEAFLCTLVGGVVGAIAQDHDAFAWVPIARLGEFATPPADIPIIYALQALQAAAGKVSAATP